MTRKPERSDQGCTSAPDTSNPSEFLRPSPAILFATVNSAALRNGLAICRRVLPGGKVAGREYVVLNPHRQDHRPGSFKVNLRTGRWADFATEERGGDLIALVAWRYGVRQIEAAQRLAAMLGLPSEVQ
jgi:hypothetical protein